jgi:hypothetical protein
MADNNGLSSPIEAYIKYFRDVKPYHTKILETLRQFNFVDLLNVTMGEDTLHDYTIANRPLCDIVQLGTEFDEGFIFSDAQFIVSTNTTTNSLTLSGDQTSAFAADDIVALFGGTGLAPNVSIIDTVSYSAGTDLTTINFVNDLEDGRDDQYTQIGKEFCNLIVPISGAYGEIFDDSDLVTEASYVSDNGSNEIVVSGNVTYDQRFQIISIPNSTNVVIEGDQSALFGDSTSPPEFSVFRVIPRKTYEIVSCTANTFVVEGNQVSDVLRTRELEVLGTGVNDGRYGATTAVYDPATNETTITINATQTINTAYCGGILSVENSARNRGFYNVTNATFDGINTIITVDAATPFELTDTTEADRHGTIVIRTGMTPRRIIRTEVNRTRIDTVYTNPNTFTDPFPPNNLEGDEYAADANTGIDPNNIPNDLNPADADDFLDASNVVDLITITEDVDYVILRSNYDPDTDQTTLEIVGEIGGTITGSVVQMFGHLSSGYDSPDIQDPDENHLSVIMTDKLEVTQIRL